MNKFNCLIRPIVAPRIFLSYRESPGKVKEYNLRELGVLSEAGGLIIGASLMGYFLIDFKNIL